MPPASIFDLSLHDLDKVQYDRDFIRSKNPQRGAMEHLDAIIWSGPEGSIGYKEVRADEFWVEGHIPGRPLLPGVIMIEAAAQLASFYAAVEQKWGGFIGFGGVDGIKFRQPVSPGCRMLIMVKVIRIRHGRINCDTQGWVDGTLVFEGQITGTRL